MSEFRTRLKKARKHLRMKQEKFASLAGVTRSDQFNYETGRREPRVSYLLALQEAGVDVVFLLTGLPTKSSLTEDEVELLTRYRALNVRSKVRMLDSIEGQQPPSSVRPAVNVTVAGDITQQINGDVYGDISDPRFGTLARKKK